MNKTLGVSALVAGLLLAIAFFFFGRGGPAQPRPQGGPPAPRSLEDLCAWLTKEYEGYGTWGTDALERLGRELDEAQRGAAEPAAIVVAQEALAEMLLRHGENAEAVGHLEQALDLATSSGMGEADRNRIRMALGIGNLRMGETSHCIEMQNSESCLFPVSPEGVWFDTTGAVRAIGYFEEYLRHDPDDTGVAWLLNLANMVAGTWPEGVEESMRVQSGAVDRNGPIGRFQDVAGALNVDTFNGAGGAIMDDFDGDGLLDLVTSSMFPCEPLRYYHSQGDGSFEERTEACGLSDQLGGLNCVQVDYDGDGNLDVFVLRGAWMGPKFGRQRNSLLRNDLNGASAGFQDVTVQAGMGLSAFPTQSGDWADYDNDGDLDLYVGNELFPNELFQNQGDGTFQEVAVPAGVDGGRLFTKGVAWGDLDNDGLADLYSSNWVGNNLYHNQGDGTFVDIGEEVGVDGELRAVMLSDSGKPEHDETFATWFWDFDNDGWLDIYVGGYAAPLNHITADYLGREVEEARRLRIYRNDGRGGFENVAKDLGVDDVRLPMGANYGDVDNDGWLDFYLGTGRPQYEYLLPNVLYLNQGGRSFLDVTAAAGVGHLQKGHAIALGDLDNDGDQDIYAQMGGFYPADGFRDSLFENPGNGNRWVTLVLRGSRGNRFAVGARVRVVLATPTGERSVHVRVGHGGSFGASSLQQEIGLGDARQILRVEVRWPSGGSLQTFENLPLDRFVELTEGQKEFRLLERPLLSLGG